jgi:hypothetical protein
MPYLDKAETWLAQSSLLLQARPTTVRPNLLITPLTNTLQTRITTKYTLVNPSAPRKPSSRKIKAAQASLEDTSSPAPAPPTSIPEPIRASLVLKTYDHVSGTTLKYSTTKAAEVSRLIQILGRLGRPMARLPEVKEDIVTVDAAAAEVGSGHATPLVETAGPASGKPGQGNAGGKKGKKKGKR